ncbi:hypothetical protein M9H77_01995 [Catharanthus roseus]|uniref:Uncharacterized protein n=1 Tax=Catharanthus roseus TaxID=4058 RepID=A0ACC0C725_CATRO|nr:hypothetical protein M9H77_01995 [Catharanthus roseus]
MSERIKTHQHSFYTRMQRNMQCYNRAQWTRSGSQNKIIGNKSGISNSHQPNTVRALDYQTTALPKTGLPWDQPQCRVPPDSSLGGLTPPQSMMWCPHRPIGPHPPRSTPLFKWIHSPESKSSTPSEEALVREISHVQCNPLTLPNIST